MILTNLSVYKQEDADPVYFRFYRHMCTWALEEGELFTWAWLVTQWNWYAYTPDPFVMLCNIQFTFFLCVFVQYSFQRSQHGPFSQRESSLSS